MLEDMVINVLVEERIDSILTVDVALETYFAESTKNCEQHSFAPANQSSFLRLLQMVYKQKFQRS